MGENQVLMIIMCKREKVKCHQSNAILKEIFNKISFTEAYKNLIECFYYIFFYEFFVQNNF